MWTYWKFKNIFQKESYLKYIKSAKLRKSLTLFRISAHILAIERGRYRKIDKEIRLCKFCKEGAVEDECHFFLKCDAYENERKSFLEFIVKHCTNFRFLDKDQQFIWLLSCEDKLVCNALSTYVHLCFHLNNKMEQ